MFNTCNVIAINRCCTLGGKYYPTLSKKKKFVKSFLENVKSKTKFKKFFFFIKLYSFLQMIFRISRYTS